MKRISVIIILILTVMASGCSNTKKEMQPQKETKPDKTKIYEGDTTDDITMTIKDGTLTNKSATVVINDLSKKEYIYNKGANIYVKDGDTWFYLPPLPPNIIDSYLIAYHVDENGILEFDEYFGQELKPGEYKLVKSASLLVDEKKNTYLDYDFSVDFTIN